jgi:5-methyltetrahydrofolate--homocysteine methyltransferase
MWQLL